MARGMLENSYQLVSKQFDPNMEDNTFGAQMVEKVCSLQTSQVILKEAYEHHGKLLTEILWRLQNPLATQSSAEKNSQAGPFIETPDVEYQTYKKRPWYEQEGSNNDGDASPKDAKQNRLSPEAKADGDWLRRGEGALAVCIKDQVTSETPADEVVGPVVIKEKVLSLLALETNGECMSIIGHGLNRVYVKMSRASDDELQMMNQNFRFLVQVAFSKVSHSLFVAVAKSSWSKWKEKRPREKRRNEKWVVGIGGRDGGGSGSGYKPLIIQELHFKHHMKARRFCQKKFKMFAPFSPQNTMSFTIRMEESSRIVSLISPYLVNSVNLPMLNFSPLQEKLCSMGGETFMLINLHHLPCLHYIIEQSSILISFLSIVIKQIVVQEAEEPKKMVIDLKNATSLVLELCRTFFTRKLIVQSLSVTFFIFLFSITNTLYSLAILENNWSGFTLHKWWQNVQFWPLGGMSAHPATILQQLLKMIAGVDISEVVDHDDEFSRGAK